MLSAMQDFFFGLKLKFLDAVGCGVFFCLRQLERRLSPAALWTLVSPLAAGRTALNMFFKKTRCSAALPEFLHGLAGVPAIRQQRRADYLNRLLKNFPDRLAENKWRTRCQAEGLEHWHAAHRAGRPVVLAFFHFGPIFLMSYWLRALGIPAAAYTGGKSHRRLRLGKIRDSLSPVAGVPNLFYTDELRQSLAFLDAGNALLIAIDSPAEKNVVIPGVDGWNFAMPTGPIRMAAWRRAVLIPFSLVDTGGWNFRLQLHRPVPDKWLSGEENFEAAAKHLLAELLPVIQSQPEQCRTELARRFCKK